MKLLSYGLAGLTFLCEAGAAKAASVPNFSVVAQLSGQAAIGAISGTTIYGTLTYGGAGNGALFSLTTSGSYTLLHNFVAATDGSYPNANLVISGNTVWGTAQSGGAYGGGTVFKYGPAGFAAPHAFGNNGDGSSPLQGPVTDAAGDIYGTTSGGAIATNGNLFELTNKSYLALHDFLSVTDGHCPFSGVARTGDGTIYGTTVGHGFGGNPNGSVWSYVNGTLKTIYVFDDGADGEWPDQAPTVVQGYVYGTTHIQNGSNFAGSIWVISPAGALTVLHSMVAAADGYAPNSPLIMPQDGWLYGTTASGGANGFGTVFRITRQGRIQVLHTFAGGSDGAYPTGSLVKDSTGAIYGATQTGSVFRLGN